MMHDMQHSNEAAVLTHKSEHCISLKSCKLTCTLAMISGHTCCALQGRAPFRRPGNFLRSQYEAVIQSWCWQPTVQQTTITGSATETWQSLAPGADLMRPKLAVLSSASAPLSVLIRLFLRTYQSMVCPVQCRENDIQCQSPMSRYNVADVETVQESSHECQPEAMLRPEY